MDANDVGITFAFFNEIGIIDQLATAVLETHLPDGLIAPHFSVLNHLVRVGDGRTPLQMARAFQVPKTSMTHTLAGLEKRGLITMAVNPDDKRSKQVWLTDAGRAVREDTIAALVPAFSDILAPIDPARIKAALPLLSEMRAVMDRARDT